jgi:hypothetical protein
MAGIDQKKKPEPIIKPVPWQSLEEYENLHQKYITALVQLE